MKSTDKYSIRRVHESTDKYSMCRVHISTIHIIPMVMWYYGILSVDFIKSTDKHSIRRVHEVYG